MGGLAGPSLVQNGRGLNVRHPPLRLRTRQNGREEPRMGRQWRDGEKKDSGERKKETEGDKEGEQVGKSQGLLTQQELSAKAGVRQGPRV